MVELLVTNFRLVFQYTAKCLWCYFQNGLLVFIFQKINCVYNSYFISICHLCSWSEFTFNYFKLLFFIFFCWQNWVGGSLFKTASLQLLYKFIFAWIFQLIRFVWVCKSMNIALTSLLIICTNKWLDTNNQTASFHTLTWRRTYFTSRLGWVQSSSGLTILMV